MLILIVPLAIAIVCFIIYALDRRSKGEPIVWESALKMALFGGVLASGVVFSVGTDTVTESVKTIVENVPLQTQDMFVGVPTF